jgi:glyoxylase I family protein
VKGDFMSEIYLHHLSIVVADLQRSIDFYSTVLGLQRLTRPPFKSMGAWFGTEQLQLHLNEKPNAKFAEKPVFDPTSFHFALRVKHFDQTKIELNEKGFLESFARDNPKTMIVDRDGIAGFPQLFIFDPDYNMVEINARNLE